MTSCIPYQPLHVIKQIVLCANFPTKIQEYICDNEKEININRADLAQLVERPSCHML